MDDFVQRARPIRALSSYACHVSVMKHHHCAREFRYGRIAPTTLSATSNLFRRDAGNCAARECSDRQRDRNILLSKRFTRGLLKVVVARAICAVKRLGSIERIIRGMCGEFRSVITSAFLVTCGLDSHGQSIASAYIKSQAHAGWTLIKAR
jgi:hypothetical protein